MPAALAADNIRLLLFDVGGVLVELKGVAVILDWLNNAITTDELWHRWLHSAAVRQFETGQIDSAEFATSVIQEFALPVTQEHFLESFIGWPTGLYPGTLEFIARIPAQYRRALLSNSNALHWPRVINDMGLAPHFHHHPAEHRHRPAPRPARAPRPRPCRNRTRPHRRRLPSFSRAAISAANSSLTSDRSSTRE